MAKGLEDTSFYRFFPLASLNEVGGDVRVFGYSPAIFHKKSRIRLRYWPNAILPSATHDTKRSEDVRARINVLSEIPAQWSAAIDRWHGLNASHRRIVAGQQVPGRNEEYLLYQTLLGTWPFGGAEKEQEWKEYSHRIEQYMAKAANEAKIYTSWVNPNRRYDDALSAFIRSVLAPDVSGRFLDDFRSFQVPVAWGGFLNSLSQQLLKIASPGVPDLYQGTELWDFSLVDPDNRRLVDFELRRRLMAGIAQEEVNDPAGLLERLLRAPEDGRIKLYLTRSALRFRRSNSLLFSRGGYVGLNTMGKFQRHVIAFARTMHPKTAIAAVGRFFLTLGCYPELPVGQEVWGDDAIVLARGLAGGEYRDVFTGRVVSTTSLAGRTVLPLSEVFSHAPFALLVHDA